MDMMDNRVYADEGCEEEMTYCTVMHANLQYVQLILFLDYY